MGIIESVEERGGEVGFGLLQSSNGTISGMRIQGLDSLAVPAVSLVLRERFQTYRIMGESYNAV